MNSSESSALPPEFSHTALQALVRKGRTTGSVTGEQVADALCAADVRAARGRYVTVHLDRSGPGPGRSTPWPADWVERLTRG